MHRFYRCQRLKDKKHPKKEVDEVVMAKFTDLICGTMRDWKGKDGTRRQALPADRDFLQRIMKNGSATRDPTAKQRAAGRTTGQAVTRQCLICRRYLNGDGEPVYHATQWECKDCKVPLCNVSRVGEDGGRLWSCKEEHLKSNDPLFLCHPGVDRSNVNVPRKNQVCLIVKRRRSGRARNMPGSAGSGVVGPMEAV